MLLVTVPSVMLGYLGKLEKTGQVVTLDEDSP
jgi:long-subunit acyl-CoA synthetase (AMP-forming)